MDSKEVNDKVDAALAAGFEKILAKLSSVQKDNAADVRKAASGKKDVRFKSDSLKTKEPELWTAKDRNIMTGRFIRYMALAGGNAGVALQRAEDDGEEILCKAVGQATLAGGGALIPTEMMGSPTEFLRAEARVRGAGVPSFELSGKMVVPFIDAGSSTAYTTEATNALHSNPTFGQLEMSDHTLMHTVAIDNTFLRNAGPGTDEMIANDSRRAIAAKEDVTFIRSTGSSGEPKGMLYWCPAANKIASNATVTLTSVNLELSQAVQKLLDGNVNTSSCFWLFAPRTWAYLFSALTTTGAYAFRGELEGGKLFGFPFFVTSQIPITLGSGDKTEVYLAAANSLLIGDNGGVEVTAYNGGTYHNGSTLVSGISQNQTVLSFKSVHDFAARQRGAEIAVIEAVKWGV